MPPPAVTTSEVPITNVDHRHLPCSESDKPNFTIAILDHRHLPDTDGSVQHFHQQPQNDLLTGSLMPRLRQLYPDGQFAIGQDTGIYWRQTDPPLNGCKAPDWFFVPGVPPMLDGLSRRSYVLWKEAVRPLIVMEFVSGDGSEERDRTPYKGKFWVYEQAIAAPYYAIFDFERASLELFRAERGKYLPVVANAAGRYPVEPWGVELGIWKGEYRNQDMAWLRFWDSPTGEMLLYPEERAESERKRADEAIRQRDEAAKRAALLAARLRAMGIDPDAAV